MKITLDLDSTLCNFMETWNLWLYEKGYTQELLFTEEVLGYDWHYKTLGPDSVKFFKENPHHCYRLIKPYEGAKDFLSYCLNKFDDVEILTSSDSDASSSAKINFCIREFDFYNVKVCYSQSDKYKQTAGRILVDDYPKQIIKHVGINNDPGILFNLEQKFGWARLKDYGDIMNEFTPNKNLIYKAFSYDDVKIQLDNIKKGVILSQEIVWPKGIVWQS